jgi:hypothetical protein
MPTRQNTISKNEFWPFAKIIYVVLSFSLGPILSWSCKGYLNASFFFFGWRFIARMGTEGAARPLGKIEIKIRFSRTTEVN